MNKKLRYLRLLPFRVKMYGYNATFNKVLVDLSLALGFPLPPSIRWRAAHVFHTNWKLQQLRYYGIEEYNRRIDLKSHEVLNDFYEVGTDFTGLTVVDVGCGTRGILPIINARCKMGVDPTLNKVWNQFKLPEDTIYISEKAEEISLESGSVDIVACNNTLNHVEDPDRALAQIHRILKPGGLLLLEVFIEPMNIAHTVKFSPSTLGEMVGKLFTPLTVKYERLQVKVEIDEKLDGELPMRWGGVFKKC